MIREPVPPPAATIATAPGALPLLGHLVPLVRGKFDFLRTLSAHGDLVRVRVGPWRALVVTSADLSHEVLRDDRVFDKGGYLFDRIRETGGNGLVSCPHADHRRQRRLVRPSFHRDRLPGYVRVVRRQVDDVLGRWRDGVVVDVLADMQTITARTMLPGGLPAEVLDRMSEDMDVVLAGVAWRSILPKCLDRVPTPANRRYRRAQDRLRALVTGVIADHRASDTDHDDLLSGLLASCEPRDGTPGLSDAEVHDQVLTFLLAGTETTANVVCWALHLVSRHPDLERRLRAEAADVLDGADVTPDDLERLALTRNVVLETLRLYPPVFLLTRLTTKDTRLGGHDLPAGTTVAYSPYVVQRRAEHFPDPDAFVPDRWDGDQEPPRGAFLAFGGGARRCVGDAFGMAEATLMLATITRRWSMRPTSQDEVRPATSLVLSPRALRLRPVAVPPSTPHTTGASA
ncbi:MAG: cytochrome P450 [Umezawaea sp.]